MRISNFFKQVVEGWCIVQDALFEAGFHYFFSIADIHCPYNNPTEFEESVAEQLPLRLDEGDR